MPVITNTREGTVRLTAWATLVVACCLNLGACKTLNHSVTISALMRTDTTEFSVARSGQSYGAKIGFVFENTAGGAISSGMCLPNVEKRVMRKGKQVWEAVSFGVVIGCDGRRVFRGQTLQEFLLFSAPNMETYMSPGHWINTIDGTYRLGWLFVEGTALASRRARRIEAVSNEFHMTLRPPQ
jgi:hypothetical protein